MNFTNIIKAKEFFDFIDAHPRCTPPEVKAEFKVPTSKPPTKEEVAFYRILDQLHRQEFVKKINIKSKTPGGPKFLLSSTQKGKTEFSKISVKENENSISAQGIKDKFLSFSEENQNFLEELSQEFLELLPGKCTVDQEEFKRVIQDTHKKQDEKLKEIFGLD